MLSQEFDNKTSTVDPALFIYFCPFLKSGEVIQNASGFGLQYIDGKPEWN